MTKTLAFVAGIGLLGAAACSSPSTISPSAVGGGTTDGRSTLPTIAEIAVADGSFSTLVAALQKADLVDTFNGNRHFTVFAPTNAAFDAAAVALLGTGNTGPDLINALDVPTLTSVLQYHVTRGDRNARSVLAAGSLVMLDNNTAAITAMGGVAMIETATIIATDIRASNGIVHVIDGVILPPALR